MASDFVFTAKSRLKKRIHLTKVAWLDKILKDHPELSTKEEYVNEERKSIEEKDETANEKELMKALGKTNVHH